MIPHVIRPAEHPRALLATPIAPWTLDARVVASFMLGLVFLHHKALSAIHPSSSGCGCCHHHHQFQSQAPRMATEESLEVLLLVVSMEIPGSGELQC